MRPRRVVRSQPILTGGFCWAETFPNGFAFIHTANSPSKGFVLPKGENAFAFIHSLCFRTRSDWSSTMPASTHSTFHRSRLYWKWQQMEFQQSTGHPKVSWRTRDRWMNQRLQRRFQWIVSKTLRNSCKSHRLAFASSRKLWWRNQGDYASLSHARFWIPFLQRCSWLALYVTSHTKFARKASC